MEVRVPGADEFGWFLRLDLRMCVYLRNRVEDLVDCVYPEGGFRGRLLLTAGAPCEEQDRRTETSGQRRQHKRRWTSDTMITSAATGATV